MFTIPLLARKYSAVPQREDTEAFLPKSEKSGIYPAPPSSTWSPYTATTLLILFSVITASLGFSVGQKFPSNLDATCTRHTSKYSPILDENIISYEIVEYDGRFTKENIFRQGAGPEVDAAWDSLGGGYRPMLIPDKLAAKAGLTRNHTHRNPELGGGYPVFMEGMHQLHCLDMVRKSLYYNYDYYIEQGEGAFSDDAEVLRWHVSHCVDIIRQRLMCTVDTGVFGGIWVNRTNPETFVDFNTKHVCKNFDAVRAYAERNQMTGELPPNFWEIPGDDVYIWDYTP